MGKCSARVNTPLRNMGCDVRVVGIDAMRRMTAENGPNTGVAINTMIIILIVVLPARL